MIQPGLERISLLLRNVRFPWKSIHVAGTNGKGSVTAYASTLLARRIIKHGRFSSPHLMDRWDCIELNGKPVQEKMFKRVEKSVLELNEREHIEASEFEILTATAFLIFNEAKVDIGVVEVGMGGRLDATNILDNQLVSVITSISHDHQKFLGNSLSEIASHKAGILKPGVPYLHSPQNEPQVQEVIRATAKEVGAGPELETDTKELRREIWGKKNWIEFARRHSATQEQNARLAFMAVVEALKGMAQSTEKAEKLVVGLKNKTVPGRMHLKKFPTVFGWGNTQHVLLDGAHNEAAAGFLSAYVNRKLRDNKKGRSDSYDNATNNVRIGHTSSRSVTWVLAMSEGRDARRFLAQLIRPGDSVVTTTFDAVDGMPWVKPVDPKELLRAVQEVVPDVTGFINERPDTLRALCTAKYLGHGGPIVVTGSLYLIGQLLREDRDHRALHDKSPKIASSKIAGIDKTERDRVYAGMHQKELEAIAQRHDGEDSERKTLEYEIEQLETEVADLESNIVKVVEDQGDTTPHKGVLKGINRIPLDCSDQEFAEQLDKLCVKLHGRSPEQKLKDFYLSYQTTRKQLATQSSP